MPPRGRKRKSEQSVADTPDATATDGQKIATKFESTETPSKRRKIGVSISQKQALLDNLQLEVTERARKLRAQYNLQAQGLRTRVEMRVNRIPRALRKVTMGDLLSKHSGNQSRPIPPKQTVAAMADRVPPPVPEKDFLLARPISRGLTSPNIAHAAVGRPAKRLSDDMATGDKENIDAHLDNPKKRQRAAHHAAPGSQVPPQVLSPASSNSRLNPRERDRTGPLSPVKAIARPVSPEKQAAATSMLSSMVEKARSKRVASTRKPTTSSTTSTATRTRKATGKAATAAATTTRTARARKVSATSESSEVSTSTVVRKASRATAATAATKAKKATGGQTAASKKTVMGSIKKGVSSAAAKRSAATKAAAAAATTTPATTRSGRVLRKRD